MTHGQLVDLERSSIRNFVAHCSEAGYLHGDVLDFGSGEQPYRLIVVGRANSYTPYDSPHFHGSVARKSTMDQAIGKTFDAVLCTQVIQYCEEPLATLHDIRGGRLKHPGYLVMTYPTHWPELRDEWHRFTKIGMERLLKEAGYKILVHEERGRIEEDGFSLAIGYGVVAQG